MGSESMNRRKFFSHAIKRSVLMMAPAMLIARTAGGVQQEQQQPVPMKTQTAQHNSDKQRVTLFLCGDVMTGRGIDQILPYPGSPEIFESYLQDARSYVDLAEKTNGPIKKPVPYNYIWGDALAEFERVAPDLRIINLETSVTTSNRYWRGKGINYRMHPRNIECLSAAGIDGCALANNHVLDWGYQGLTETLATLELANIKTAGAGVDAEQAGAPAIFDLPGKGRIILFSCAEPGSGVPYNWYASTDRAGINLFHELSSKTVDRISRQISAVKQKNDIVIVSIHWGSNWGYEIPAGHRRFAHELIDKADVDVIHGHSSHHPKGIEKYRNKPVIYGCGDFINDYEGISGHETYRGDLSLMYFVTMNVVTGELVQLELVPTQIKHLRVNRATPADAQWLNAMLNREGSRLHTQFSLHADNTIHLKSA
jgi:poly-gamma-glutamate synthesis protein (capsule biosynthesis protein)